MIVYPVIAVELTNLDWKKDPGTLQKSVKNPSVIYFHFSR